MVARTSPIFFIWLIKHYRKTHNCRVSQALPSARPRALGNDALCRVPDNGHSANMWHTACQNITECWLSAKKGTRHSSPLPSAIGRALGKDGSRAQHARPPCAGRQGAWRPLSFAECWHSAKRKLRRVSVFGTRQSLFLFLFFFRSKFFIINSNLKT